MTKYYLHNSVYSLLLALFFFTSCNGQNKTQPQEIATESKTIAEGRLKVIKTQGTSQYANIYCGLMDKIGNLWFGTMGEGVYRYDARPDDSVGRGKSFFQFTTKNGLCNNHVYSIMEDAVGNIWFGTAYGVCKYNGKDFITVPIAVADENGSSYTLPGTKFTVDQHGVPAIENTVWCMMQDKKGIFWFGTTTGVYCYNGIFFTRFLDNKNIANTENLHLKMIDYMLEDKNGNIWFCSGMLPGDEGICRYDGKSIIRFKPNGEGWVRKVIEDKEGNLYFATRHNGVLLYDGNNFTNFTKKAGIDNGSVNTILKDKSGNIWIGTELGSGELGEDGGVWRYDGKSFTRFTTKDGLVHNGVFCIVEDKNGNLWFGSRNIGLCRYDTHLPDWQRKNFTSFSE